MPSLRTTYRSEDKASFWWIGQLTLPSNVLEVDPCTRLITASRTRNRGLVNHTACEGHRMAENKRQSAGAKASQSGSATGSKMASGMVPLEAALSGAIGAR